jgi:hypothetical protein
MFTLPATAGRNLDMGYVNTLSSDVLLDNTNLPFFF